MLPSDAISKLLEGTFDVVEEWARECKKNLNEAQAQSSEKNGGEHPAQEREGVAGAESPADGLADLLGAFRDAEEQMKRIQGATLRATQAFVQTLKTELETEGDDESRPSDAHAD